VNSSAAPATTCRFGTGTARHHFCRSCGISPFRRARSNPDEVDVNARCLVGVDLCEFESTAFDGRHWEEALAKRPKKR